MKTSCIYHNRDLDGFFSAAIVKYWFVSNNEHYVIRNKNSDNPGEYDSEPIFELLDNIELHELDFIGYDYGDKIPDYNGYDIIIMCDITFPPESMIDICNKIGKSNFIWLDHHITAINNSEGLNYSDVYGIRDINLAACQLTWQWCFPDDPIPEIIRLVGLYDSFKHKNTEEEIKVLEFQYGMRQLINNYEDAYLKLTQFDVDFEKGGLYNSNIYFSGQSIYKYLCSMAKQTYSRSFPIELIEPEYYNEPLNHRTGVLYIRKFLCVNDERFNPVNFGIDYHKDGYDGFASFFYKNKKWEFSLYNDNGLVDVSAIAKYYGGGGHKGAAGFTTKKLFKII